MLSCVVTTPSRTREHPPCSHEWDAGAYYSRAELPTTPSLFSLGRFLAFVLFHCTLFYIYFWFSDDIRSDADRYSVTERNEKDNSWFEGKPTRNKQTSGGNDTPERRVGGVPVFTSCLPRAVGLLSIPSFGCFLVSLFLVFVYLFINFVCICMAQHHFHQMYI